MTHPTKERRRTNRRQHKARDERRGRQGYSAQVRADAVTLLRTRKAEGIGLGACAEELGISTVTLRKWLKAADDTTSSQSAQHTSPPATPAMSPWRPVALSTNASPAEARLSLTTPGGYRIEGLSLEQALVALGRLP
jgi:transposase-like protein